MSHLILLKNLIKRSQKKYIIVLLDNPSYYPYFANFAIKMSAQLTFLCNPRSDFYILRNTFNVSYIHLYRKNYSSSQKIEPSPTYFYPYYIWFPGSPTPSHVDQVCFAFFIIFGQAISKGRYFTGLHTHKAYTHTGTSSPQILMLSAHAYMHFA